MIAQVINFAAIVLGGLIGTIFGNKIGEKLTNGLLTSMALVIGVIGVQGAASAEDITALVICIGVGTAIGIVLKLDDRICGSGDWVKSKLEKTGLTKGRFSDAFVTSTLLFAVGTMAILGSIQAGVNHNYDIIIAKSLIDFISAIAFSAALGPGVMFSAVPVFIVQGSITLLAVQLEPLLFRQVIDGMTGAGGPIFIGMSINMLGLRQERIKVGDMIPAVILPVLYYNIAALF